MQGVDHGDRRPFFVSSSSLLCIKSVSTLKKVKREATAQRRPACSFAKKTALFPRNDRPYSLKYFAFQTGNAQRQPRNGDGEKTCAMKLPKRFIDQNKARWGKDGGPGGRTTRTSFLRKGWAPCALAATEWRPRAVPVRRRGSLTGIDGRDKEVSFPPEYSSRVVIGSRPAERAPFARPRARPVYGLRLRPAARARRAG